jgi:hypothetical protein
VWARAEPARSRYAVGPCDRCAGCHTRSGLFLLAAPRPCWMRANLASGKRKAPPVSGARSLRRWTPIPCGSPFAYEHPSVGSVKPPALAASLRSSSARCPNTRSTSYSRSPSIFGNADGGRYRRQRAINRCRRGACGRVGPSPLSFGFLVPYAIAGRAFKA